MQKKKILIVEDEGIVALDLQNTLEKLGYEVTATAISGEEALDKAEKLTPDLVLMDIMLQGDMDGIETTSLMRSRFDVPVVYLTAYADEEKLERAKITEPFGYMVKPFQQNTLHTTIEMALLKHKMEKELRERKEWLSTTLKSIGDGVIAIDGMGNLMFMNLIAESLTGWRKEDAIGKPMKEVFHALSEETGEDLGSSYEDVIQKGTVFESVNLRLITKEGVEIPINGTIAPIKDDKIGITGVVTAFRDVSERKRMEDEKEKLIRELQKALNKVKTLQGFLPICANCKKIRDDKGFWHSIEAYVRDHSEAEFTHGICDDCVKKLYPDLFKGGGEGSRQ